MFPCYQHVRYAKAWNTDKDKCAIAACDQIKPLPNGYYFNSTCGLKECSNAQAGEYYVRSDNTTSDKCAVEKCQSQQGRGFVSGWANTSTTCPMQNCSQLLPIKGGYYEYQEGFCKLVYCTGAKRGEYYTTAGNCASVGKCTNAGEGEYYTFGWSNGSSKCPVASCASTPRPGLYDEGNCNFKECTNAPAGYFYTSGGSSTNDCEFQQCTNAEDGYYYVDGFRTSNTCPTKACDVSKLKNGYYFEINHEQSDPCRPQACPAQIGYYFTNWALVKHMCNRATTKCTNKIGVGMQYTKPSGSPLVTNNCPGTECPALAGYRYTEDDFCQATEQCDKKQLGAGQYFTAGEYYNLGDPCKIQNCSDDNRKDYKFVNSYGFYNSSDDCADQKATCQELGKSCRFVSRTDCGQDCTPEKFVQYDGTGAIVGGSVVVGIIVFIALAAGAVLLFLRHRSADEDAKPKGTDIEMGGTMAQKIALGVSECKQSMRWFQESQELYVIWHVKTNFEKHFPSPCLFSLKSDKFLF